MGEYRCISEKDCDVRDWTTLDNYPLSKITCNKCVSLKEVD